MLKKLIKYDFIKMFYILPYFFIATLFFATLTRIVNIWKDIQFMFILGQIFQGTAIALMINSLINAVLGILIRSFKNSFYSDESYLTHTLPVSKNQLFLSKFISALIVLSLTIGVIFISLMIIFYSNQFIEMLKQILNITESTLKIKPISLILLIVFTIFFQFLTMLLIGFASIVKGHSYNNGKIAKSFWWFAIFYVACSIISLIIVALVLLISGNIAELTATVMKGETLIMILITALFVYTAYTGLFYFITTKLFNKGVNVD